MWILLLMIVVMPFGENPYLTISSSFLGVIPEFTVIKLLGMAGLAWTASVALSGRMELRLLESTQAKAFAIFVLLAAFVGLAVGAGVVVLTRLMAIVLLLPVVLVAVREEDDLRRALAWTAGSLIMTFPYGLRQMMRFGGRYGIGLYESNYLSAAVVLVLPIAIVMSLHSEGRSRTFWRLGIFVLLAEIVLSGSRGAFLGLMLSGPMSLLRFSRRPAMTLVAALVGLVLLFTIPNPLAHRLSASGLDRDLEDAGVQASNEERLEIIRAGLRIVADYPLTGIGLGRFHGRVEDYGELSRKRIAHNTWLEVAAEMGLPALLAFLSIPVTTLLALRRSERLVGAAGQEFLADTAAALRIGIIGFFVAATFISAQFERFFWLVLFLTIPLERMALQAALDLAEQEQDA